MNEPGKDTLHLRLTINVTYDLSEDPDGGKDLEAHLASLPGYLADRGLLSTDTGAIVTTWGSGVEQR